MLFNSLQFIFLFFPIVFIVSFACRGNWLLAWITFSSFAFYALFGQAWFLIPMAVTTLLDFFAALYMEKAQSKAARRALLGLSLCGNLGLLMYFKYGRLFLESTQAITAHLGFARSGHTAWMIILPAGISFYTFQTLSYILDVYRREAPVERNVLKFAAFVSFFPHLIAGPLTRHHQLLPALERLRADGVRPRWPEGLLLFGLGLCKKVLIADPLANVIDPSLNAALPLSMAAAWLVLLGYAMQIYFDFSGYCDMAIGLARLFGIELPQNFNAPYQATNPADFWRRWHMTLSSWLRDYLYIPLGGGRGRLSRKAVAVLVTFFLGGLWHGARWTFAAWGLYHAALLIGFRELKPAWESWPVFIQRAATLALISLGWVFFRAGSFPQAATWFRSLAGAGAAAGGLGLMNGYFFGLLIAAALITQVGEPISLPGRLIDVPATAQIAIGIASALAVLLMNQTSRFLYFQF